MKVLISLSCAIVLALSTACATIIYVPQNRPSIQSGINAAVDGDTVLVADGVWTGSNNRNISFDGKAIVVMSQNGPLSCFVDCNNYEYSRGFTFTHGEDSTSVLDGFTIRHGHIILGGGIKCDESSPKIINCHIIENTGHGD